MDLRENIGYFGRALIAAALAVAFAAAPFKTAAAGPPVGPQAGHGGRPAASLLIPAAVGQCTRLVPTGGREIIVNACSRCRVVNIIRKRPGNEVPVSRSYNVPPRSTFPVPFRGPGRSRITSVLPCRGDPGAAQNLVDPSPRKQAAKACVALGRAKSGDVVLINSCATCKAVLVERQNRLGRGTQRQAYKVNGQSMAAVASKGAAQVGLVGEIDCP
ncbi:MAG: hypothetical protein ACE5GT_11275 [Rhodospirillales bacterium]